MNVNEFAERVVFGTTLEEKLRDPGDLTFAGRAKRVSTLATPGRPSGLELNNGPGAAQTPSDVELEQESGRGKLLHFLANHELLATELMALVLLRFPDAPIAFRRGIVATLREEQRHTRMYLHRMQECGVEFGSYPLSGHFWRVVESMREPIDFVARLSLTFEQANLDYSKHFSLLFRRIGDNKTSRILEHVYNDEVGHVQHGLHWFRQWKSPSKSDWDAYQSRLEFPMSPERARGAVSFFDRVGRTQAGLTEEFIDEVELFRQSRGRTPTVRWFDPGAEASLLTEHVSDDSALLEQLGKDLEHVMLPLSKRDDVLLVRRLPSNSFRRRLLQAGFDLPEFVPMQDRSKLACRRLHDLQPWAWTPNAARLAESFSDAATLRPRWKEDHRALFRKSWSASRLRAWLASGESPAWFTPPSCVGVVVSSTEETETQLRRLRSDGFDSALFKSDLATAGRGQRRLSCSRSLLEQDRTWLESSLSSQIAGVVEPELDRVLDLSFLWRTDRLTGETRFRGWARALVTPGRRYAGTRLGRPFSDCDVALREFLLTDRCARLHFVKEWLEKHLLPELSAVEFRENFGVDVIVCRNLEGNFTIKPLVEFNPRTTMGHVALELERHVAPGVAAEFRVCTRREWERIESNLSSTPLTTTSDGRWKSGVVLLGEPNEDSKLFPLVTVSDLLGSISVPISSEE